MMTSESFSWRVLVIQTSCILLNMVNIPRQVFPKKIWNFNPNQNLKYKQAGANRVSLPKNSLHWASLSLENIHFHYPFKKPARALDSFGWRIITSTLTCFTLCSSWLFWPRTGVFHRLLWALMAKVMTKIPCLFGVPLIATIFLTKSLNQEIALYQFLAP